jgi:P27 family predicted phage terminase small subunit
MRRGPRPQPTNLKLLRGNPGCRVLKPEPQPAKPAAIPQPPDFLGEIAKAEWWRVASELFHLGLLTDVDVNPLAAYCQAFEHWRTAEITLAEMAKRDPITRAIMVKGSLGNPVPNPIIKVAIIAARDMVRFAAEFGLTPSSRARVAIAPDGEEDRKFQGLLA